MFNNTVFKFAFGNLKEEVANINKAHGLRHTISINKEGQMVIAFAKKCECGKQHYFKFADSEFDVLFGGDKSELLERSKHCLE